MANSKVAPIHSSEHLAELEAILLTQLSGHVKSLRLVSSEFGMKLTGNCGSFHAKQMAQELLEQLGSIRVVANEMVVTHFETSADQHISENNHYSNQENMMPKTDETHDIELSDQVESWGPVEFIPLDRQNPRKTLDSFFEREKAMQSLAKYTEIDDEILLGRLVDAGFDPTTLPALRLAPLAFVTWASDSVTEAEGQAAVWSMFESQLLQNQAAASRMQTWLDLRPEQDLWDLWVNYTLYILDGVPASIRERMCSDLLHQATAIAMSSGGFLGVGSVCRAERVILDGIRRVFDSCE